MPGILCPSCNTPAPPGAVFCDYCGYDLRTLAAGPQSAPPGYAPAPQANTLICSMCRHPNLPGAAFCENCGAQLSTSQPIPVSAGPTVVYPAADSVPVKPSAPSGFVSGRLVIKDSQVSLVIPTGKTSVVLGREDPVSGVFPDIDLDPHGGHEAGVGRRHAQLVWKDGQVCLEDLDSVNGTAVNHTRLAAHQPHPLQSGDELLLGKLAMVYYA